MTRAPSRRATARPAAISVVVAVVLVAAACSTQPPGPVAPPPCPSTPDVVQFDGDSLGIHIARYLEVPGGQVVDRSVPRSGFTYDLAADPARSLPAVPSIGGTVRSWIEACGVPGIVVVEGGINDLAGAGATAGELEAAVLELSDWLRDRGVPTVWLPLHPLPTAGSYMWVQPARQEFNAWLEAGHVWGTVVDCNDGLEDPAHPDTLAPTYWWVVDIWGTVEGVHPDQDGYRAWSECLGARLPPLTAPG